MLVKRQNTSQVLQKLPSNPKAIFNQIVKATNLLLLLEWKINETIYVVLIFVFMLITYVFG